tara:strand:+ start:531 stop:746 length:216 start_codon:yes stop_codon:yes gene_type:complete
MKIYCNGKNISKKRFNKILGENPHQRSKNNLGLFYKDRDVYSFEWGNKVIHIEYKKGTMSKSIKNGILDVH